MAKAAKTMVEQTLDIRIATAPQGIVFCSNPACGAIRSVGGVIPITNQCNLCGGNWSTLDDIDPSKYDDDVKQHRDKIADSLGRWKLEIPSNVEISLYIANHLTGSARNIKLMRAHEKAEYEYYRAWSSGKIEEKKEKGPPMPESVKELLKRRKLPDPVNVEPLMKVTIKSIRSCDDIHAIRKLYFEVYGAEAGANLTAQRMKDSMIYAIQELNEVSKRKPDPDDTASSCLTCSKALDAEGKCPDAAKHATVKRMVSEAMAGSVPGGVGSATPKKTASKGGKIPIYEDRVGQADREAKYPWIIPGSWRADPEHAGGTILDIKCQICGKPRTIHAADAFQVKSHVTCKKGSKG